MFGVVSRRYLTLSQHLSVASVLSNPFALRQTGEATRLVAHFNNDAGIALGFRLCWGHIRFI